MWDGFLCNSKSGGDTELSLSSAVDPPGTGHPEGPAASRLEEGAHVNLMKFSQAKCKVLHPAQGSSSTSTGWGLGGLRAALGEGLWW